MPTVEINVNGVQHRLSVDGQETLLATLRDALGLYGAREGCGIGMCGACTVLVDGNPISSCLALSALQGGRRIETIEGLAGDDGTLHPIQQTFLDYAAFQCAFCTPGFILTTKALLEEEPAPTPEGVRAYLAGNLCRCASYQKIEEAVIESARRLRGETPEGPVSRSVHESLPVVPETA